MPQLYLRDKCYNFERLPSVPSLLVELLDLCYAAESNFSQLAKSIEKDPGLSAKIIQLANSTLFRQWNDVTEIRRMLVVLGMDNVRQIVISGAVHQFFANFDKEFGRQVQQTWVRAMVCSNLALRIAQLTGYQKPQEAYLAGLLYQVGQLLLLLNQQPYQQLLAQYEPSSEFCALEKSEFGNDHCELGAALIESWQLESFIADAVLFQKSPTEELRSAPTLIKIIAVASLLSSASETKVAPAAIERAGVLFNLTESSTRECLATAMDKARQVIKDLGMAGSLGSATKAANDVDGCQAEKANQQLAGRIKELALANSHCSTLPNPDHELAKNLRATFEILFNIKALFLIRNDHTGTLRIVNDLKLPQLDEISFNTADEENLLTKTVQSQTPQDSFSATASLMDKQLARLLKSEGVHFVPLLHGSEVLGLLALGVSAAQQPELGKKRLLLNLLCKDIGRNLQAGAAQQQANAGISYEQLGRLAHELSNPLTIIKNYLYVLGKKIGKEHAAQEEIAFIDEEIDRVANILLRAKDPDNEILESDSELDLNRLIVELDRLLGDSLYQTAGIRSRLQLDENIPVLFGSRDKTKQILVNLLKNACEALPSGGKLEVGSRDGIYQNGREYVEISLRDNGPGIPRQILQQLFQPVTSTKAGHSGVGLSIVSNLINEMSGQISCSSSPEKGTEFKIYLPRTLAARHVE